MADCRLKLAQFYVVTFRAPLEETHKEEKANSTRVGEHVHAVAPTDPVMNMHFPPLSMCRLRRDTVDGRSLLSLAATRRASIATAGSCTSTGRNY